MRPEDGLTLGRSPWQRRGLWALAGAGLLALAGTAWHVSMERSLEPEAISVVPAAITEEAPRRAPAELTDEERKAFSEQVLLLNRNWGWLAEALAPMHKDIRLLELDVDAKTSSIRVTGLADSRVAASDYAAAISRRLGDESTRLVSLDANAGAIRFKIQATWPR